MEKTLAILNQLEREGIIGHYAIGGAVAYTLHRTHSDLRPGCLCDASGWFDGKVATLSDTISE